MTKQVRIGDRCIGGGAPVLVQSMTNTDTRDTDATISQIHSLEAAGCELVRCTVPDLAAAKALSVIRPAIRIPLAADIHFDYRMAIAAMENGADKIRFNPGNIGDDAHVRAVADCAKLHHVPIRIGVNGGSLEKGLRERCGGDLALAMVESALRHAALLEKEGFFDIVLSVKASAVPVTVRAYRLLSERCPYPLHLGITETGTVEAGIIKSAAGIGALLLDGIGDTIRVSLSAPPVREVEVGLKLLRALDMRRDDVDIIACPTCGRTKVDLMRAVERVDRGILHNAGYLKIAVMGCAVNGVGEAGDADIGIAFGKGNGVLFKAGRIVANGSYDELIERLIAEANELLASGGA